MKNIFTIAILMMIFATASFAQAEKTIVKTITASNSAIAIELPGQVEVKKWDKDYIRVTITVTTENCREEILKRLVDLGRYEIKTSVATGELVLSLPKISNRVFISGDEIFEKFKFEVQIPFGSEAIVKSAEASI